MTIASVPTLHFPAPPSVRSTPAPPGGRQPQPQTDSTAIRSGGHRISIHNRISIDNRIGQFPMEKTPKRERNKKGKSIQPSNSIINSFDSIVVIIMAGIGGTGIAIESALMSSCRSVPIVRSCRINFGSFLGHFWVIFGHFRDILLHF